jgi:hypothetical protein
MNVDFKLTLSERVYQVAPVRTGSQSQLVT